MAGVEMRVLTVVLLLSMVLRAPAMAEQKERERTYTNDEFGFSFVYPIFDGVEVTEKGRRQSVQLEFGVMIQGVEPVLFVAVLSNPDSLDLKEYAYERILRSGLYSREEFGVEKITVADEQAIRMTFFTKAGTGCATSLVFISHADRIYLVDPMCDAAMLPTLLDSFEFHKSGSY
jgi:hypothetical protein